MNNSSQCKYANVTSKRNFWSLFEIKQTNKFTFLNVAYFQFYS